MSLSLSAEIFNRKSMHGVGGILILCLFAFFPYHYASAAVLDATAATVSPTLIPPAASSADSVCFTPSIVMGSVTYGANNLSATARNMVVSLYDAEGVLLAYTGPQSVAAIGGTATIPGTVNFTNIVNNPISRPFNLVALDLGTGIIPPASYKQAQSLELHQFEINPLASFPSNAACQALPLGPIDSSTSLDSVSYRSAGVMMTQIAGMVKGRINRGLKRGGAVQGGQPERGLADLSAGRTGLSAGDDDQRWGGWGNVSWSGIEDKSAVAGQKGGVFTGIVGADYAIQDGLVAGMALSLGGGHFDSQVSLLEVRDRAFGITPYLAWQIDDIFSLDGLINYTIGRGETVRNHTITGNYDLHRYYLAANGNYFNSWGDFSLFGTIGLSFGQSFEGAYTENDGSIVKSRQSRLGTLNLEVKPAYLFTLNRQTGLFLEPYLLGAYNYDFTASKITGHPNDNDAFRVGGGMSLFSGNGVSGSVEASTMLGRRQQRDTNVSGTVTFAF